MKLFVLLVWPVLLAECHEGQEYDDLVAFEEINRKIDALDDQLKESDLKIAELEQRLSSQVYRSCEEMQAFDPWLPDGIYRIDPDGSNVGDDPISVYCDMSTGSTVISHNSEETMEVNCSGNSCFKKQIDYRAPIRQMIALARLSRKCHQKFELKYNCKADDLMLVESSWWRDRYNTSRPFDNCIHKTEADSACSVFQCAEFNSSDILPVTGLNVGTAKAVEDVESLNIRLNVGPLTCSGSIYEKVDASVASSRYSICPSDIGPDTNCFAARSGCYCLNQIKRNWTDAAEFCRSRGMRLVAVETEEEQNTLAHLLISFDYNWWWTSGSDELREGRWMWSEGSKPVTYTNWGNDEPDGDSAENYIQLTRNWGYRWGDYSASDEDYSICEL